MPVAVKKAARKKKELKPHNATTVLVLGILGLVFCFICGIFAWAMGKRDLEDMDNGIMDPSGRDTTNAGRLCGKIATILFLCVIGIYVLIFSLSML